VRAPYVVVVELCVSEQGDVSDAVLKSSASARLDPVVLAAVMTWRYQPLVVDGAPRPFCHEITIEYTLP
jgi:TonB family protein